MGPVSIITGSTPGQGERVEPGPRREARARAAFSSLMMRAAEAPSVIWLELPAVTLPSGLNAGLRLASVSTVVPSRMPSSAVTISSDSVTSPVSLSRWSERTGTISFSNRPSAVAWAARRWLSAEKASSSSRVRPHLSAISSAEMPWGTRPPTSA